MDGGQDLPRDAVFLFRLPVVPEQRVDGRRHADGPRGDRGLQVRDGVRDALAGTDVRLDHPARVGVEAGQHGLLEVFLTGERAVQGLLAHPHALDLVQHAAVKR